MIVKGAVAFSRAKQLPQLLGAAWLRGRDGAFVPFLTVEGWVGAGGGLLPPAAAPERLHRLWFEAAPRMLVPKRLRAAGWDVASHSPVLAGWAGVPSEQLYWEGRGPPRALHTFVRVAGIVKSRDARAAPCMSHAGRCLGCPLETGSLAVGVTPFFPCRIFWVLLAPQLPSGIPVPAPLAGHPVISRAVAVLLGSRSTRGALGSGGKTSCTDQ